MRGQNNILGVAVCLLLRAIDSPGVKLALVGHKKDLHLLLEADGSLAGGGGAHQWHGGAAAVVVAIAKRVEGRVGGEGRLIAVGSFVKVVVAFKVGLAAGNAAVSRMPNSRSSPLLLSSQHVPGRERRLGRRRVLLRGAWLQRCCVLGGVGGEKDRDTPEA